MDGELNMGAELTGVPVVGGVVDDEDEPPPPPHEARASAMAAMEVFRKNML